jgi:hypothetical protein
LPKSPGLPKLKSQNPLSRRFAQMSADQTQENYKQCRNLSHPNGWFFCLASRTEKRYRKTLTGEDRDKTRSYSSNCGMYGEVGVCAEHPGADEACGNRQDRDQEAFWQLPAGA